MREVNGLKIILCLILGLTMSLCEVG